MTEEQPKQPPIESIEMLDKITRMVRHCVFKTIQLDIEQIAVDIWTEIWQAKGDKKVCWMHIRNRVVDNVRKAQREATVALTDELIDVIPEEEQDTFNLLDTKQFLDEVMRCPKLSSLDRTLLYLRFYQDLSGREIAEQLGGSLNKVKVNRRLASLLVMLRGWARDYCQMYDEDGLLTPDTKQSIRRGLDQVRR